MNLVILAASLRKESLNKKLAALIAKLLGPNHNINQLDFATVIAPIYNGDHEDANGLPQGALFFIEQLKNADGLIIVSPEYNFATPGSLKNLLDWVSRAKPMPLAKFPTMLASASPSQVGGNRGLIQTLITLQAACTATVFPKMFCLALADQAFKKDGDLIDQSLQERLGKNLAEFTLFVAKNNH